MLPYKEATWSVNRFVAILINKDHRVDNPAQWRRRKEQTKNQKNRGGAGRGGGGGGVASEGEEGGGGSVCDFSVYVVSPVTSHHFSDWQATRRFNGNFQTTWLANMATTGPEIECKQFG